MSQTNIYGRYERDAGTTLIEVLVVVAVTALIGGIAFPRLQQNLGTLALRQAASALEANLRIARAEALRSGGRVVVAMAPDGRSYGWLTGSQTAVPGAVHLNANPNRSIEFYPDGTSTGGHFVMATAYRSIGISIDSFTGIVTVQ